jgi:Tol biopolymer transport system component
MTSRTRLSAALLAVLSLAACDGVTEPGERAQEKVLFRRFASATPQNSIHDTADIYVMNADGTGRQNLTNHLAIYTKISLSPDGRRVLFAGNRAGAGTSYIWVTNLEGTEFRQLTTETSFSPRWSPDGTRIAFEMVGSDDMQVYVMNADGTNRIKVSAPAMQVGNSCSTTSKFSKIALVGWIGNGRIAFTRHYCGFGYRNFIVNADGSGFTQTDIPLRQAHFTPDGSLAVVTRWEGGGWRLFLMNADGSEARMLTTQGTSQGLPWGYSAWSPDGKRIMFFAKTDGQYGNEPQSCDDNALPYVMNVDGSGVQRLMDFCINYAEFNGWSPSGEQVAFTMRPAAPGPPDLYVAKADGSGSVNLTSSPDWESDAVWLPRQ